MKYHHIGLPTKNPQKGEIYLAEHDTYCTDHENNPYGIQFYIPRLAELLERIV